MKKKIISILLLASVIPRVSYAQETSQAIIEVQDEYSDKSLVAPLAKGKRAPFTGLLLTPRASAEVITKIDSFDSLISLEVKRAKDELNAKHDFEIKELKSSFKADKEIFATDIDRLKKQLKDCESIVHIETPEEPPSRITWAGIGFLGGIVATSLAIFTVQSMTK